MIEIINPANIKFKKFNVGTSITNSLGCCFVEVSYFPGVHKHISTITNYINISQDELIGFKSDIMSHDKVAENSKNLASSYANKGNFGRAFSHYLVALKLKPEWRSELQEEFSTVLYKWGSKLDEEKRFNDLFMCYEQAVEVFPRDPVILNNIGAHLVRCGLLKEAALYFRKCLTINPYFIRAAHNLENVSNLAIERWHFRMLNDQHRNEAFREAIIKKIRQGFATVLDVGTGTGILSLFSWEGKAKEIYACDSSSIMIEIAENVCRANKAFGVKLINKHSSELQVPEDIPEKISLLVTETFDAGLLGEDVLATLSHAWKNLLRPAHPQPLVLSPDKFGVVVPFGATVYLTGLELDEFANDCHLFENINVLRNCDDYDTQDLSRAQFKCLTETKKVLEINFNDPDRVEEILKGKVTEMTLTCKTPGRLDCFVVWFDLYLDEDIVLSTSPLSRSGNSAWDQAIFPLPRSRPIEEKQHINVTVAFDGKKLNVSTRDCSIKEPKFETSENVINILNNKKLIKVLHEVAGKLSGKFDTALNVLDCCCFPVLGLNFLMQRRGKFTDRLISFVPTDCDTLVSFLAKKYDLKVDVVVNGDCSFEDSLQDRNFDLILLDLTDTNGEIKDRNLLQLDYVKSILNPGGIILPQEIEVIGQFIYSDWLWKASEVDNNNSVTCGYNIAEYINKFQVRHFVDLDLRAIEYSACSEPFVLFSIFDSADCVVQKTVPRCKTNVHSNALVYWFIIKFLEDCECINTKDDVSYHQASILFSRVELPDMIKFNVIRSDGLFNIEFLK